MNDNQEIEMECCVEASEDSSHNEICCCYVETDDGSYENACDQPMDDCCCC